MSSVWKPLSNGLELKFHIEKCVWVREPCSYHQDFDDGCYDCGHYEWRPSRFEESILHLIDENGYVESEEGRFRVLSNSLAKNQKKIRQQVEEAIAKKNVGS